MIREVSNQFSLILFNW